MGSTYLNDREREEQLKFVGLGMSVEFHGIWKP